MSFWSDHNDISINLSVEAQCDTTSNFQSDRGVLPPEWVNLAFFVGTKLDKNVTDPIFIRYYALNINEVHVVFIFT